MPSDSMTVDVTWDGVAVAKGATVRVEGGGWFVELEQPMPVGTRVVLTGDLNEPVDVVRVHEGIGAGMLVKTVESRQSTIDSESEKEGKKEKRKRKR